MDDILKQLESAQPKVTKSGKTRSEIAKSAIRKGKTGERTIADYLTEASGLKWIRIPSSGAYIGKSNRDRIHMFAEQQVESMLGDIFPPPQLEYRYIIESKNYKEFPFNKLSKGNEPALLRDWIDEICYDTETYLMSEHTRDPLSFLVFKITKQGQWIAYNKYYMLQECVSVFNPAYKIIHKTSQQLKSIGMLDEWYIEDFKQFIDNNSADLFKTV